MTVPDLTLSHLAGEDGAPLLVVGPSLGTSVRGLWDRCALLLGGRLRVVGWDLPGHGESTAARGPFTMAELAAGVLTAVDRDLTAPRFAYAGDSIGGAVGLQLALDAAERLSSVAAICTGARIGTAASWVDRAALIRREGTAAVLDSSEQRWFGPGFVQRHGGAAAALLSSLRDADAASYALACEALSSFDVRGRLAEVTVPLLAIAGAEDVATPAADLRTAAGAVRGSDFIELAGVAHLAPAEAPEEVAQLVAGHALHAG